MSSPVHLPDAHEARMLLREHLSALIAIGLELHDTPHGRLVGMHAAALLPVLAMFSYLDPPAGEMECANAA